jgi:hypothetical protein
MHIRFPDAEQRRRSEEDMTLQPGCKFVMFSQNDDYVVTLFSRSCTHADIADVERRRLGSGGFVGAGFVMGGVPRWGSESCEKRYGYDRPPDAQAQQRLLASMQSAIAAL